MEELYLKENFIESLPSCLSKHLHSLTNIYLCKNLLTTLPTDIGSLALLTVLDVSKERNLFIGNQREHFIFDSLEISITLQFKNGEKVSLLE